jgi:GT2 family glycosyltransferase
MKCITVIVVNWNSGALLAKCLQHLKQQTISPACVFVIDNASSDNPVARDGSIPWLSRIHRRKTVARQYCQQSRLQRAY